VIQTFTCYSLESKCGDKVGDLIIIYKLGIPEHGWSLMEEFFDLFLVLTYLPYEFTLGVKKAKGMVVGLG
jgi:hypothetical protein